MNKNTRKRLSIAVLSTFACTACAFGALSANSAVADGEAFHSASIDMVKGASVRYYTDEEGESGIRFSAVIDSQEYQALEAMEETEGVKVSYGMVIAPYTYFQSEQFNEATVFGVNGDKKYTWDGDEVEDASAYTKIAHVTYDSLIASKQEGYEDCHEIKGSLIAIKEQNLTKEFVGRGYIKYEYENGVAYKFASYQDGKVENSVRSIVHVAQLAIEAGDASAKWVNDNYVSKVAGQATTYSVATYVGDELVKTDPYEAQLNSKVEGVEVAEYEGFELVSSQTGGTVYANGKLVLKHVYEKQNDSTFQVQNGGFEKGELTDWTVTGEIGAVSNESNYWVGDGLNPNGFPFGKDGEYMFSSYKVSTGDEKTGYLQSSAFTVAQSGWLTFKIGGMKNSPVTFVEIVDAQTNEVYKRYGNTLFTDVEADGVKPGCRMYAYKADLSSLVGKSVYVRVSDYSKKDYGVVFADSFDALHIAEPKDESYTLAVELGFSKNAYELYNGSFDEGLNGWIRYGEIGVINEHTSYWGGNYENEGKFFSAYAFDGAAGDAIYENQKGALQSGLFTIGGSGWITYRLGGVKNPDQVYMEVIDAVTGEKLAHFYNEYINSCTMVSYKANLSEFNGKLVYINIVDEATADYGLIFCDSFVTYYENAEQVPASYREAVNYVYNVMNGGFETGNLSGWTCVDKDVPGRVTDFNTYWNDPNKSLNKDGNFSFTGVQLDNGDFGNLEHLEGVLRSNVFRLKANSSISFKMSGSGADRTDVGIRIVNAETGKDIAWYCNHRRVENGVDNEAKLILYDYDIGNGEEVSCYIEIVDYATSNWGLIGLDSVRIYQK